MVLHSWFLRSRAIVMIAVTLLYATAWWLKEPYQMAGFATETQWDDNSEIVAEPVMERRFVSSDLDDFVHSSSITTLPGGDLLSVWFAGTREGAADVQIRAAR